MRGLSDLYIVQTVAYNLQRQNEKMGEDDLIIEDMEGLVKEIVEKMKPLDSLLAIYMELLCKERYKYDPILAYQKGGECRMQGGDYKKGLYDFFRAVETSDDITKLYSDLMKYHNWIARALGSCNGLLEELLEEYRQVYGTITLNIDVFFRLGYDSVRSCNLSASHDCQGKA